MPVAAVALALLPGTLSSFLVACGREETPLAFLSTVTTVGRLGPNDIAESVVVSPDVSKVVWIRVDREARSMSLLVNGKAVARVPGIAPQYAFSDDGESIAVAVADEEGRSCVVHGDAIYGPYPAVGELLITPDGKHLTFGVTRGSKRAVVMNGDESELFDFVSADSMQLTAGGKLAFAARRAEQWFVFVGDDEYGPYEAVRGLTISKDGEHFAFIAKDSEGSYCVHDGKASPVYDSFIEDGVALSADGTKVHLLVNRGDSQLGVLNGDETAQFYGAVALTVSSRGEGVAFIATQDEMPRQARLFFRGELGPGFDAIGGLTLSPDGSRAAYGGRIGGDSYVVVDDARLGPYVGIGGITFSPDGSRYAFIATDDDGISQVVDGEKERAYHAVGEAVFSSDGAHVAYWARLNESSFLVVDGQPADFVFSKLVTDTALAPYGPSSFRCAYEMFNRHLNIRIVETTP